MTDDTKDNATNISMDRHVLAYYFRKYEDSYMNLKQKLEDDVKKSKKPIDGKYLFVDLNVEFKDGKWDYVNSSNAYSYDCIIDDINDKSKFIVLKNLDSREFILDETVENYLSKFSRQQMGGVGTGELPDPSDASDVKPPFPPPDNKNTTKRNTPNIPRIDTTTRNIDSTNTGPNTERPDNITPQNIYTITLVFQIVKNDSNYGYQINPDFGYKISKYSCNIMNGEKFDHVYGGKNSINEYNFNNKDKLRSSILSEYNIPNEWKKFNMQKYNNHMDKSFENTKFNIIFYRLFYNLGNGFTKNVTQIQKIYLNQEKSLFDVLCFKDYNTISKSISAPTDAKATQRMTEVNVGTGHMEQECVANYSLLREALIGKDTKKYKSFKGLLIRDTDKNIIDIIGERKTVYQDICYYLLQNETMLKNTDYYGRILFYLDMYKNFCIFMASMGSFFRLRFFQILIEEYNSKLNTVLLVDVFNECLLKTCNEVVFNREWKPNMKIIDKDVSGNYFGGVFNKYKQYQGDNEFFEYIYTYINNEKGIENFYKYYEDKYNTISNKPTDIQKNEIKEINTCVYKEITNLNEIKDSEKSWIFPVMCHLSNFQFLLKEQSTTSKITSLSSAKSTPRTTLTKRKGGDSKQFTRKLTGGEYTHEIMKTHYFLFTCMKEYYWEVYKFPDKKFIKRLMQLFCEQTNIKEIMKQMNTKTILPVNNSFDISVFDDLKQYYTNLTTNAVNLNFGFTDKSDAIKVNTDVCGKIEKIVGIEEMIKYFYLHGYTYYVIYNAINDVNSLDNSLDNSIVFPLLNRTLESIITDSELRTRLNQKYNSYNTFKKEVNSKMVELYSLFGYLKIENTGDLFFNIEKIINNLIRDYQLDIELNKLYSKKFSKNMDNINLLSLSSTTTKSEKIIYSHFLVALLYQYITKLICEILKMMNENIDTPGAYFSKKYNYVKQINLNLSFFINSYGKIAKIVFPGYINKTEIVPDDLMYDIDYNEWLDTFGNTSPPRQKDYIRSETRQDIETDGIDNSIRIFALLRDKLIFTDNSDFKISNSNMDLYNSIERISNENNTDDLLEKANTKHVTYDTQLSKFINELQFSKVNIQTPKIISDFFRDGFSKITESEIDIKHLLDGDSFVSQENRNVFEVQTKLLSFVKEQYEKLFSGNNLFLQYVDTNVNEEETMLMKVKNIYSNVDIMRKYIYNYAKQLLTVEPIINVNQYQLFLNDSSIVESVLVPIKKILEDKSQQNSGEYFLVVDELNDIFNDVKNKKYNSKPKLNIKIQYADSSEPIQFDNVVIPLPVNIVENKVDAYLPLKTSQQNKKKGSVENKIAKNTPRKGNIRGPAGYPGKGGSSRRTRKKRPSLPTP